MGRRNCKHGINVLLGTLFIATTMMRESLNLNSDCIQKQRNFFTIRNFSIIDYSHQILICVSQGHQVLLASRIYYGLKYRVCQIMLLFTLSRYFHSVQDVWTECCGWWCGGEGEGMYCVPCLSAGPGLSGLEESLQFLFRVADCQPSRKFPSPVILANLQTLYSTFNIK